MAPEIVIVDYGMGNLFSLQKVIKYIGGRANITSKVSVISSANRVILPGVGAFRDGIENLRKMNLISAIHEFVRSCRPILGICLGMQLFMQESEEFGITQGLSLVAGRVRKLCPQETKNEFYKIPHVGWNKLRMPLQASKSGQSSLTEDSNFWKKTIFENIYQESFVYFNHSYVIVPENPGNILSETVYGDERFCSAVYQNNLFGCQFHPEISGEIGLQIIRNFCTISSFC